MKCSRHSCLIGYRDVRPEVVKRDFRCSLCEGMLELVSVVDGDIVVGYTVWCHHCNREVEPVHVGEIRKKFADSFLVSANLPPRFRKYVVGDGDDKDIDTKSAAKALFGEF